MKLFEIFGDIKLNDDGVDKKLDNTDKKAKSLGERMDKFAGKMKNAGNAMADKGKKMTAWAGGAAVAVGAGLLGLASKTGDYADRILDLNAITGMSTDSIQEWQHVTKEAGVPLETITNAAEKFTKNLNLMEAGTGKQAESLEKLGLSFEQVNKMTPDERMDTLIKKLAEIEDPAERARVGTDLLGNSWAEIAPVVAMGADAIEKSKNEAQEMGAVMDGDALNGANNYRISMEKLKTQLQAGGMALATEIMPYLQDFMNLIIEKGIPKMQEYIEKIKGLVEWYQSLSPQMQLAIKIVGALVIGIGPLLLIVGKTIAIVGSLITTVKALGTALTFLNANPIGAIIMGIAAVIAIGVLLWKNWDTIKEKAAQFGAYVKDKWNDLKTRTKEVFNNIKESMIKPIDDAKEKISNTITKIKGFFTNLGDKLKIKIPKPKLPKFSLTGKFSVVPPSVPKLNVTWNADGALFTRPTIFNTPNGLQGFGEAGPEVALPLRDNVLAKLAGMINKHSGGGQGDIIVQMNGDNYINSDYDIEEIGDKLGREVRKKLGFSGRRS